MMKAWSYSALNDYQTCAHKYYKTRVTKEFTEPKSPQIIWGEEVHKALEHRILYDTPLPATMEKYEPFISMFAKSSATKKAEEKLAVTRGLEPCDFDSKDAWCRGIIDLLLLTKDKAIIVDYKTGNYRPGSKQLTLMALLVFAHYPNIEEASTAFLWLKNKKIEKEVFTRKAIGSEWPEFMNNVSKLETSFEFDNWPANPSGLCKAWCPVITCIHNGRRE